MSERMCKVKLIKRVYKHSYYYEDTTKELTTEDVTDWEQIPQSKADLLEEVINWLNNKGSENDNRTRYELILQAQISDLESSVEAFLAHQLKEKQDYEKKNKLKAERAAKSREKNKLKELADKKKLFAQLKEELDE